VFTGNENSLATILIQDSNLEVQSGHLGTPDVIIIADTATWLKVVASDESIYKAILLRRVRLPKGPADQNPLHRARIEVQGTRSSRMGCCQTHFSNEGNYMSAEIINSPRSFQIWSYSVSHSQLLFRSTKSAEFQTRVDVFFKGVSELHLPTAFKGLSIAEADADIQSLCIFKNSPQVGNGLKVFIVRGTDFLGYVVALVAASHEDNGEYNAPSFFSSPG
jgi:hypothetical protein